MLPDDPAAKKLTPAELLSKVEKWICKLAKDASERYGFEFREVQNEITLKILERADRFDPKRSKPSTWCSWWAMSVVSRMLRDRQRAGRCHAYEPAFFDETMPFRDHEPNTPNIRFSEEQLHLALRTLPSRERDIIARRFLHDSNTPRPTLAEVGEAYGDLTRERIRQLEQRALKRLREWLLQTEAARGGGSEK